MADNNIVSSTKTKSGAKKPKSVTGSDGASKASTVKKTTETRPKNKSTSISKKVVKTKEQLDKEQARKEKIAKGGFKKEIITLSNGRTVEMYRNALGQFTAASSAKAAAARAEIKAEELRLEVQAARLAQEKADADNAEQLQKALQKAEEKAVAAEKKAQEAKEKAERLQREQEELEMLHEQERINQELEELAKQQELLQQAKEQELLEQERELELQRVKQEQELEEQARQQELLQKAKEQELLEQAEEQKLLQEYSAELNNKRVKELKTTKEKVKYVFTGWRLLILIWIFILGLVAATNTLWVKLVDGTGSISSNMDTSVVSISVDIKSDEFGYRNYDLD